MVLLEMRGGGGEEREALSAVAQELKEFMGRVNVVLCVCTTNEYERN
jgi:hypothetical protein